MPSLNRFKFLPLPSLNPLSISLQIQTYPFQKSNKSPKITISEIQQIPQNSDLNQKPQNTKFEKREIEREREMNGCMIEFLTKLALWHTRTFKPIMTHSELEPIMATLGFVGQPPTPAPNGVVWKEYIYVAAGYRGAAGGDRWLTSQTVAGGGEEGEKLAPPRPRLPYRRIDGLHIYTYRAFIDAVGYYLEMDDISQLFHIRGMPLHRAYDQKKKFRQMEAEENIFVYREGTLDPSAYALYHVDKSTTATTTSNTESGGYSSIVIRSRDNSGFVGTVVPLKDIIV